MQEQEHRVVAVLAANRDPLLDATDLDVSAFVDSVPSRNCICLRIAGAQELERRPTSENRRLPMPATAFPARSTSRLRRTGTLSDDGDADDVADRVRGHSDGLAEPDHGCGELRDASLERTRSAATKHAARALSRRVKTNFVTDRVSTHPRPGVPSGPAAMLETVPCTRP